MKYNEALELRHETSNFSNLQKDYNTLEGEFFKFKSKSVGVDKFKKLNED